MYRLSDVDFMREALRLAEEGTALASPNPRVGAVVVSEGEIVGRGSHRFEQLSHAEVLALEQAGERARGATLYVNLEPCCHTGRTPPCSEAIVAGGIARVVAALTDPNPQVAGGGFRALEAAGVRVETGCLEREARRLNRDFSKWVRTGLPLVTLKAAVSLDGRIAAAPASRTPLSSAPARERVQQMRHAADAVLTGIGTVLADDPLLTDRSKLPRRRRLLRAVADCHLRLPLESQLVRTARRSHDLLVFHTDGSDERATELTKAGARVERMVSAPDGRVALEPLLRRLGEEGILGVLLEAGAAMNGAMLAGGWVDRMVLFQVPCLLGEAGVPLAAGAVARRLPVALAAEPVGCDLMLDVDLTE
ncbi:MAG: bifunctional diaminohydroxyphosphoribosylaminopyrimidine deaminase/5-amino-6-(5-phosphoribosylamino)uracil reductase RibD [Terriglobales bacterium]